MNIFVAKLGLYVHKEDLKEAFQAFGDVISAHIVVDKYSGRSKGFGFVEMANETEALEAIRQLDNSELNGHNIFVQKADPDEESSRLGKGLQ